MATNHSPASMPSLIAGALGAGLALTVIGTMYASPPPPQAVDRLPNCTTICADPGQVHSIEAWQAWDKGQGWRTLRAATTDTRVDYVGWSTSPSAPDINALTEVALPSSEGWFVFRATPANEKG